MSLFSLKRTVGRLNVPPAFLLAFVVCTTASSFANRHEGKITPKVHLFKGKRSETAALEPDFLDELIEEVEGEAVSGEVLEATPEDAQEWLTDAIAQGTVSIPDEDAEDEVPHKDVGQDKPFKF